MRNLANGYLRCTEKLVFAGTVIKKVPSTFTMQQSGEFHVDAETVFLRVDLICAALNLVSNERKVTLQESISGAYGRVLARKSDMGSTGKGPQMKLPGLPWIYGIVAGKIDNLRAIDLTCNGNKLDLALCEDSSPTLIRYYWPWGTTKPKQGRPMEPSSATALRPSTTMSLRTKIGLSPPASSISAPCSSEPLPARRPPSPPTLSWLGQLLRLRTKGLCAPLSPPARFAPSRRSQRDQVEIRPHLERRRTIHPLQRLPPLQIKGQEIPQGPPHRQSGLRCRAPAPLPHLGRQRHERPPRPRQTRQLQNHLL